MRRLSGIHERHLLRLSSHCDLGLHVPRHGPGRASHHSESVPAPVAGFSAGDSPVAREGSDSSGSRESACARCVRGNAGRGASHVPGSARTSSLTERRHGVAFALFFCSLHVKNGVRIGRHFSFQGRRKEEGRRKKKDRFQVHEMNK